MPDPLASTATTLVVAVDALSRTHAEAEHRLHDVEQALGLPPADATPYVVSTHLVAEPTPHVALVLSLPDPPADVLDRVAAVLPAARVHVVDPDRAGDVRSRGPGALGPGLVRAVDAHRSRSAGRLVRFAGSLEVRGETTVADLVAQTDVDAVTGLAGLAVGDDTVLDLGDFYRPTWGAGGCTLLVQATTGAPIPFEVRDQIACCSDH